MKTSIKNQKGKTLSGTDVCREFLSTFSVFTYIFSFTYYFLKGKMAVNCYNPLKYISGRRLINQRYVD